MTVQRYIQNDKYFRRFFSPDSMSMCIGVSVLETGDRGWGVERQGQGRYGSFLNSISFQVQDSCSILVWFSLSSPLHLDKIARELPHSSWNKMGEKILRDPFSVVNFIWWWWVGLYLVFYDIGQERRNLPYRQHIFIVCIMYVCMIHTYMHLFYVGKWSPSNFI